MSESVLPRMVLAVCLVVWGCVQAHADTYLFSSPPELDEENSRVIFSPMLAVLSRETGHVFEYVYPDSEFAYWEDMQSGRFDLLLDEAHFASWRMVETGHVPLAKTERPVRFVVIATRGGRVYSKEDLVARPLCAKAPPDLGTLAVLGVFNSAFQVPGIRLTIDPLDRVQGLLTGACAGAVLSRRQYTDNREIRRVSGQFKIVAQTGLFPGMTLTAGPDIPQSMRDSIGRILLSRSGGEATRQLRERLVGGDDFVEAGPDDYQGLDLMLRDYPGFTR